MTEKKNKSIQAIYTELILVKYFKNLDIDLFNKIKNKLFSIDTSKSGQKNFKKLLDIFEDILKNKLKNNFSYIFKNNEFWPRMRYSLLQAYLITALIIEEKIPMSAEEAIYKICNDKKYKKFSISNWDDGDILNGNIFPAILMLTLGYLNQLNYNGKIKDKEIHKKVKDDYLKFSNWFINFKAINEEQYNDSHFDLLTCEYKSETSLKKSIKKCLNCGSHNVLYNIKEYEAVCNNCGAIIEG